jgi:S-adenosylmethionine synthetase
MWDGCAVTFRSCILTLRIGKAEHNLGCVHVLILYLSSDGDLPTILQFSSEDQMTKWQICQAFAEIMSLPLDGMEPFTPDDEPNGGTVRPYDCHLDTSALQQLGIDVSTVDFKTWWYALLLRN